MCNGMQEYWEIFVDCLKVMCFYVFGCGIDYNVVVVLYWQFEQCVMNGVVYGIYIQFVCCWIDDGFSLCCVFCY